MKQVKNKITGDIAELDFDSREGTFIVVRYDLHTKETIKDYYKNLKDLCEDWEDYEEPKEYWCIDWTGGVNNITVLDGSDKYESSKKEIGNYFETKEEAEKAVEKLKAWKRLKDKGFKLDAVVDSFFCLDIYMNGGPYEEIKEDLKIVFGGEE